jgi:SAM-dependent methyltransferase
VSGVVDYYEAIELALSELVSFRGEYRRHFGVPVRPAPEGFCWFKGMVAPRRHPEFADWVIESGNELERRLLEPMAELAPGRVLDVGCGNGLLLRRMLDSGVRAHLTGINLHPLQMAAARRLLAGTATTLIEGDFLEYPFSERFDVAYLFESAFHIADKARLCRRLGEVLAPGGQAWLIDIVVAERAANVFQGVGEQASVFSYIPRLEWHRHFAAAGLTEIEFTDLSAPVAQYLQVSEIETLKRDYFVPRLETALSDISSVPERQHKLESALPLMVQIATEYRRLSRLLRGGMLQYVLMRYRKTP